MKIIGITGGIGAGKSTVLGQIMNMPDCEVIMADDVAKSLQKKDEAGYKGLVDRYGKNILTEDGEIDKAKLAGIIFSDEEERKFVNSLIHPLTKEKILEEAERARQRGIKFFFIEGALLIEDHYELVCDEMWYVYAPVDVRVKRLMGSRGYSKEKCISIINNQLSDEDFRSKTIYTIDNSTDEEAIKIQIIKGLGENYE